MRDYLTDADDASFEHSDDDKTMRGLPFALKVILLTVFLPEGMSFFIADLRMTATRLIFIILTPIVAIQLNKKVASGRYRFVASDLFVPMTAFWMFLGPAVAFGFADTVGHSGPIVLEYMIAYMSTRVLLSERDHAVSFIGLLCFIISIVVFDALLDTITNEYFTRDVINLLTGYQKIYNVADEHRFGLLRAAGPIEHPILFGFTSAIGLLFAVAVDVKLRNLCIFSCSLGVIICFSSAPEQSAFMGLGLLAYSRMFAGVPRKWILISIVPAAGAILAFLSTDTPFGHIFDVITIDPQTAYYRLYIWNAVGPAILDTPWFSVPETSYDYEGSVDSVWLVLALTYGMPCSILTALSMIGCCSLPTGRPRAQLSNAEERLGTASGIVMFLTIFLGFTVHFWGSVWILIGLLVGVRAHLGELGQLNQAVDFEEGETLPHTIHTLAL